MSRFLALGGSIPSVRYAFVLSYLASGPSLGKRMYHVKVWHSSKTGFTLLKEGWSVSKHYMKKYGGVDVPTHVFFTSANVRGECSASRPPSLHPRYSLETRLGGPHSRSGRHGEAKILAPIGTRTPNPRSSSPLPVAIPIAASLPAFTLVILSVISRWPEWFNSVRHQRSSETRNHLKKEIRTQL
jgi:hypothetical protein